MTKNTVLLSNGVLGSVYKFSDHVVCIEVIKNGKELGSFCTDISQYEDWEEEELKTLIEQHVKASEAKDLKTEKKKQFILDRYEIEYYAHSDTLFCINVLENGKTVSSFCTDKEAFDQWMEDEEQLTKVVKMILAKK